MRRFQVAQRIDEPPPLFEWALPYHESDRVLALLRTLTPRLPPYDEHSIMTCVYATGTTERGFAPHVPGMWRAFRDLAVCR